MTEQTQPHPYGFPDDWFYSEKIGEHLSSCSIRCFSPPDPTKMPEKHLKNYALFQRLQLSLRDFEHARSAITFIREDIDFEEEYPIADLRRFTCYETTLIVSYCRPFSQSTEDIPKLSFGVLGIKPSPFVEALHDGLMAKRNKVFAHSDASAIPSSGPSAMRFVNPQGEPFSTMIPPRFQEGTLLTKAEFEQVSVLLSCLSHAVYSMMNAMHENFPQQCLSHDMDRTRP